MSARAELQLGAEPRVQLLPPMVRQREKLRETQHLAVLLLILAGAVVFAGVAFGFIRSAQAQGALAGAHAQTTQILQEQAQYTEVNQISSFVASAKAAQQLVTSNEFDWLDVYADLASYAPPGLSITGISVSAPAPWEAPLVIEGPLRSERVGIVTLQVSGGEYASAALFALALVEYEGAADVAITGTILENGAYVTTIVVTLNPEARSGRFVPVEDEQTESGDGAEQADAASTEGAER